MVYTQELVQTSQLTVQLWQQLSNAPSLEAEQELLESLWQTQENQEATIDAQAELAQMLDADIVSLEARLQYLVERHNAALEKLRRWRTGLDLALLKAEELGLLPSPKLGGKTHYISILENPPNCEVLVPTDQLPQEYKQSKTKTVITADKKAIIAAWKKGIPVDGTHVSRKRRVVYGLTPGSMSDKAEEAAFRQVELEL